MVTVNESSLTRQLRWVMSFRVVTTSFLLFTTLVVQVRSEGQVSDEALTGLYTLIGTVLLLTAFYWLVLPRLVPERGQASIQITIDIFIATIIIYMTGGLESGFAFMYLLAIINAGVLLRIRGAVLAASLSAILYGGLLDLHYYRYINPYMTRYTYFDHYRVMDIINTLLVNIGAFYIVALLSGYLAAQFEENRQKLAERQRDLERLKNLNESIIQSIDAGLITLGPDGRISFLNRAAERITGLPFSQVRGRRPMEVIPDFPPSPEDNSSCLPVAKLDYRRPDNEIVNIEVGDLALWDASGQEWGRLLVLQDKTRIRKMEEDVKKIEKLAVIGELAAGVAHEIRNPLASISGSFQMLAQELAPDDLQAGLVAIIQRELERLNHIINDFLMFARPRVGRPMAMDLAQAVEESLHLFDLRSGSHGVSVERDLERGVTVLFDREQFDQIVWNLLLNAAEAMPDGGTIAVRVAPDPGPSPGGLLTVSDNGPGIAPENLQRIFDPFYTTKSTGNGLGLSIVSRLLEAGGGRISAEQSEGGGARFCVRLPGAS